MTKPFLPLLALALLSACATDTRFAADVTRFHMAPPTAHGTVFLEPVDPAAATSLEYQQYASVIADAMRTAGFEVVGARTGAQLVGVVSYRQMVREGPPKSSPVSIGIGGGSYGNDVGGGVGATFGVGGGKGGEINTNALEIKLLRTTDNSVVWEGRAVSEVAADSPYASLSSALPELATALLRDFPGTSGQTVHYKQPK